jgi:iron complex transport system ATP-binding protein
VEPDSLIQLEAVGFTRRSRAILSDISWRIEPRQHWALLGANGSGKTTLLRILTGYEWPTTGAVRVLGEPYGQCDIPQLRRQIGWVSSAEQSLLNGWDRAIDIVVSGLDAAMAVYRTIQPEEWHRAEAALAAVGAAGIAQQPFDTLSQGEQQRVLIARALINRPRLLILDEPCAGLDPAARERFLEDLTAMVMGPDAPTSLLVTHHVEEILPWMSHVLLLKNGRVAAAGPVAETLRPEILGTVFDCGCELNRNNGRYHLTISRSRGMH